jgi:hypothetical protein
MKKRVLDVPVGTDVSYNNVVSKIIAHCGDNILLGWKTKPMGMGWSRTHDNFKYLQDDCKLRIGDEYHWFWYIGYYDSVEVLEETIINGNQVCMGCNLPAPHKAPNVGADKFICVACEFLSDLDAVAAGG